MAILAETMGGHEACAGAAAPSRIATVQAARALAANMVVLAHCFAVDHRHLGGALPDVFNIGIYGVDVFFVISGFVMVVVSGRSAGAFLVNRVTRIYPVYWIVSLVVLAVSLVQPSLVNASVEGEISVWKSLLLVPQETYPLLAVGWTLIHEMYFYLVFALILGLRAPLVPSLAVWAVLVVAARPFADGPVTLLVTSPMTFEFLVGALAAVLYRRSGQFAGTVLAIGLGGFVASALYCLSAGSGALLHAPEWPRVILFGGPSALIIYGLAGLAARTRTPRLLVAAGDGSYSTYLLHVLIIVALGRALSLLRLDHPAGSALLVVIGLVAVNCAGVLSYRCLERPILRRLRR